jgi:hypothetical protein
MPGRSSPQRVTTRFATYIGFSARIAAIATAVLFGLSASVNLHSAAAQVVLRASSTASTSAPSTSFTLPTPAGVQPGDLMLASVVFRLGGEMSIAGPAGWTLVRRDSGSTGGGTSLSQAVYFKFAAVGEPSSHSWTLSSMTGASGGIVAFSGIDPASPIDAHSGRYRNYPKSLIAPSLVTTAPNEVLVGFYGISTNAFMIEPPSGMTERLETATTGTAYEYQTATEAAEGLMAAPGSTGDRTAIASDRPSGGIGQLFALRPAGTPPPASEPPPPPPPPPAPTPPPPPPGTLTLAVYDADETQPVNLVVDDDGSGTETSRWAFTLSAEATGADCRLDAGSWVSCSSGYQISAALGQHTASVRAKNANGVDASPISVTYAIVSTPPSSSPPPLPAPSPTPPPPPPSPPAATTVWQGDMEEGTLGDWYSPSTGPSGYYGGGEYNNGNADTVASSERAHTGQYSAKASVSGSGGTRLFRWKEPRANREAYYSAWYYFPSAFTNTSWGDNIFQFKSVSTSGSTDPFLYVVLQNNATGGLRPEIHWWDDLTVEGPHKGEFGFRKYQPLTSVQVPLGRWFKIECFLRQSKDFDGALRCTWDGTLIFDLTNIRTGYPNCSYNAWCVDQHWAVNNYTDGETPSPAVIYIDDPAISTP